MGARDRQMTMWELEGQLTPPRCIPQLEPHTDTSFGPRAASGQLSKSAVARWPARVRCPASSGDVRWRKAATGMTVAGGTTPEKLTCRANIVQDRVRPNFRIDRLENCRHLDCDAALLRRRRMMVLNWPLECAPGWSGNFGVSALGTDQRHTHLIEPESRIPR